MNSCCPNSLLILFPNKRVEWYIMRSSHATITITFEGNVSGCLRTILHIFGQIHNTVGHFWSLLWLPVSSPWRSMALFAWAFDRLCSAVHRSEGDKPKTKSSRDIHMAFLKQLTHKSILTSCHRQMYHCSQYARMSIPKGHFCESLKIDNFFLCSWFDSYVKNARN